MLANQVGMYRFILKRDIPLKTEIEVIPSCDLQRETPGRDCFNENEAIHVLGDLVDNDLKQG